MLNLWSYN